MLQSLSWISIAIMKVDYPSLYGNLYALWKSGFICKNDGCFDYLILSLSACFSAGKGGIGWYHW